MDGNGNEEKAVAVVKSPDPRTQAPVPVGSGGVQIQSLEGLFRFSQYVAKSGLAPKGMESAETCLVAIEMGLELGLPPMQSLQNIAVINGRPSVWGDSAKGLVESSGLCEDFSEWFEGEGDKLVAVCEVKRAGRTRSVRWEFSVDDAKRAGLWQTEAKVKRKNHKTGQEYTADNDSPWYRYPKRMLQMRARGFAIRDAFPDVLRGLVLAEEAQDIIEVRPEPSRPAARSMDDLADQLESENTQEPEMDDPPFDVNEETGEIQEQSEAPEGALF